jgi:hypothetical protein
MHERDGRSYDQIRSVFTWANKNLTVGLFFLIQCAFQVLRANFLLSTSAKKRGLNLTINRFFEWNIYYERININRRLPWPAEQHLAS